MNEGRGEQVFGCGVSGDAGKLCVLTGKGVVMVVSGGVGERGGRDCMRWWWKGYIHGDEWGAGGGEGV